MRQPADRAEEQTETAAEIKVSLPFQIIIPGNIRNLLCRRRRRLLLMRLQVKLPVALLFTTDRHNKARQDTDLFLKYLVCSIIYKAATRAVHRKQQRRWC